MRPASAVLWIWKLHTERYPWLAASADAATTRHGHPLPRPPHQPAMTTSVPFYLVDVFAERSLAGNPLALVTRAERLNERAMKLVAREFNQSETTFLLPPTRPEATWRLRSFTPSGSEVVGAGHNALGAWWWLASEGQLTLSHGAGTFAQELGGRVLPVEVVAGDGARPASIVMDQSPPSFGATASQLAALATGLGLTAADLDRALPAQVVDTGAPHLLVAVADRGAVDRAAPNASVLLAELEAVGAQGCYLYSLDPHGEQALAYARFFNPTVGIWEDPATGSAAGPLAGLLVARGVVPDDTTVAIEQGYALGRPSLLRVTVRGERVRLGGAAVVVAEGTLRI
jgi:trans-2,3-dihydro-3-hydroxyanthranilate isomerase